MEQPLKIDANNSDPSIVLFRPKRENMDPQGRPISYPTYRLRPQETVQPGRKPTIQNVYTTGNGYSGQIYAQNAAYYGSAPIPSASEAHSPKSAYMQEYHQWTEPKLAIVPITDAQVYVSLLSLVAIGFPASILAILSLLLLIQLDNFHITLSTYEEDTGDSRNLADIAATLASISLTCSICVFFVTFLQLFLGLKVLKLEPESRLKIMRYMRQSMFFRFLAALGFFVSIPVFLLAVMIAMHAFGGFGSKVAASIFAVVGTFGLILCTIVGIHAMYSWLQGHLKLDNRNRHANNLSTLV